jgi:hypothetical protein
VRDDLVALAARRHARRQGRARRPRVAGAPSPEPAEVRADDAELVAEIRRRRGAGASVRDVADALARRELNRRAVYRLALTLERV